MITVIITVIINLISNYSIIWINKKCVAPSADGGDRSCDLDARERSGASVFGQGGVGTIIDIITININITNHIIVIIIIIVIYICIIISMNRGLYH